MKQWCQPKPSRTGANIEGTLYYTLLDGIMPNLTMRRPHCACEFRVDCFLVLVAGSMVVRSTAPAFVALRT